MKSSQLQVGQYTIHYQETGQGYPLVFLHGFLSNSFAWNTLSDHLSDRFRCIAIDLLGFGRSSKPDIPLSIERQVSMLKQFIDAMQLQEYSLLGHSMGGWIATAYALKYQSSEPLQRLVLLAPAGIRDAQHSLRFLPYLPLVFPGPMIDVPMALASPFLEGAGFEKELRHLARFRRFFRERPSTISKLPEQFVKNLVSWETVDHRLHQLQVPTLIFMGKADRIIPYSHAETYAANIPKAELLGLEDAKHNLHISHASFIAERLMRFFQFSNS